MNRRRKPITGIVLSGGGALGAYEAGIVAGIVEVLGLKEDDEPPFRVFAGTSVGAINACFLAAHGHRGDMGVEALLERWRALRIVSNLTVGTFELTAWARWARLRLRGGASPKAPTSAAPAGTGAEDRPRSAVELGPLEQFVVDSIPWTDLHRNVAAGTVRSVLVAAQHVLSGRTHIFVELSPDATFFPSRDPKRVARLGPVGPQHVLASSAVPFIFPVRRVDHAWFCDGAFNYNTPLAPATRTGCERMVVISLALLGLDPPLGEPEERPDSLQLLSRLLASVVMDRVDSDLVSLERINGMVELLEGTLDADDLLRFHEIVRATRGIPYREISTLVFRAAPELSALGADHLREITQGGRYGRVVEWFFGGGDGGAAAALLSFLLFEGDFAERLIEVGQRVARERADEIRAFFGAD